MRTWCDDNVSGDTVTRACILGAEHLGVKLPASSPPPSLRLPTTVGCRGLQAERFVGTGPCTSGTGRPERQRGYAEFSGTSVHGLCLATETGAHSANCARFRSLCPFTPAFADEVVAALVVYNSGMAGSAGYDAPRAVLAFHAVFYSFVGRPKIFGIMVDMDRKPCTSPWRSHRCSSWPLCSETGSHRPRRLCNDIEFIDRVWIFQFTQRQVRAVLSVHRPWRFHRCSFGSSCPLSADMVQTVQKTVEFCTQFQTRLSACPLCTTTVVVWSRR